MSKVLSLTIISQNWGQAFDLRFCHHFARIHSNANLDSTLVKVLVFKTQYTEAKSLQ